MPGSLDGGWYLTKVKHKMATCISLVRENGWTDGWQSVQIQKIKAAPPLPSPALVPVLLVLSFSRFRPPPGQRARAGL